MVLPQTVLRAVLHGPALVELKNGDSYSGTLVAVDNLMNIRLEDALFTPRDEERFQRLKECIIRGKYVKFLRFADDLLDDPSLQAEAASYDGKGLKGRGRGAKGKGRGSSVSEGPLRMTVPAPFVGAIIGRGGDTIRRLCAESGARIEVAKATAEETSSSAAAAEAERSIFLSGSPECVERARVLINTLVQERSVSREQHHRQPSHGGSSNGNGGGGGGYGHNGGTRPMGSQHQHASGPMSPPTAGGRGGGGNGSRRGGLGKAPAAAAAAAVAAVGAGVAAPRAQPGGSAAATAAAAAGFGGGPPAATLVAEGAAASGGGLSR